MAFKLCYTCSVCKALPSNNGPYGCVVSATARKRRGAAAWAAISVNRDAARTVQRNTGQGHKLEHRLTLTSYKYAKAVAGRRCRVHQRTTWHSCHAFAQLAHGSSCTGLRERAAQVRTVVDGRAGSLSCFCLYLRLLHSATQLAFHTDKSRV